VRNKESTVVEVKKGEFPRKCRRRNSQQQGGGKGIAGRSRKKAKKTKPVSPCKWQLDRPAWDSKEEVLKVTKGKKVNTRFKKTALSGDIRGAKNSLKMGRFAGRNLKIAIFNTTHKIAEPKHNGGGTALTKSRGKGRNKSTRAKVTEETYLHVVRVNKIRI